jgi:dihydroneopterin aldolase
MQGRISLVGMEFYAYHGYYESERLAGNYFEVDAHADLIPSESEDCDKIANTVNYEMMYAIVLRVMQESHQLLETLCQLIATEIKEADSKIVKVIVTVKKKQPPLGGKVAYSAYTLTLE